MSLTFAPHFKTKFVARVHLTELQPHKTETAPFFDKMDPDRETRQGTRRVVENAGIMLADWWRSST